MPLSDVVSVVVTTQNPSVTVAGFGVPNIISQNAAWTERSRTYQSISDVAGDWATTTPEYNAALKIFSQQPSPEKIRISRANGSPVAQRWAASLVAATLAAVYKLRLSTANGTETLASYTAAASVAWVALTVYAKGDLVTNDTGKLYTCITAGTAAGSGGPTGTSADITDGTVHWMYAGAGGAGVTSNDAIVNGVKAAVDALSYVPAITVSLQGSAGSRTLRFLANATTSWFAVDLDDPNLMAVLQDHDAPTGTTIATDLDAILDETTDFYGVVTLYNSSAYVAAVAAWVEANKKLYVAATPDTIVATTANSGATDIAHVLKGFSYARSQAFFHPRAAEFPDAASFGRWFPVSPGGDNWRMKPLVGVSSGWGNGRQYTSTQRTNIGDKHGAWYYDMSGVDVVGGQGTTASGEFVDVTRGVDWWTARVGERLANRFIQLDKIPFTDNGIALIEAEVRAQNDEGIAAGLINPGSPPGIPAPTVTVPRSGQVSAANRALRQLPGVNTSWVLAGAINHLTVNAQVTK